jgi:macrolide transport system ATP-binding/permease protein
MTGLYEAASNLQQYYYITVAGNRQKTDKTGKVRVFNGNYSFYKQQCEMEQERAALEFEKYYDAKAGLEAAISNRQRRAKAVKKAPSRMGNSEARLHTRAANEKQEKLHSSVSILMTSLEKLEVKEKPRELPSIKLDFSLTNPPENKIIISSEKLNFSYERVNVFEDAGFKVYNGKKAALWGENGTGKTTLLNLIFENESRRFNIVPKARLAYFRQDFENLEPDKSVLENVMQVSVQKETTARTILARLLIQGDAVHKQVGVLSGGERIKTAFAKMFVSEANVLLLDEPTNYLDMQSIEALENVLKEYEGTVLFVSHDKAFVNTVADRLLVLRNHAIEDFDGKLEEYELCRNNAKGVPYDDISYGLTGSVARTLLQMRLTETIAKLSASTGDKEALEVECRRLMELLR